MFLPQPYASWRMMTVNAVFHHQDNSIEANGMFWLSRKRQKLQSWIECGPGRGNVDDFGYASLLYLSSTCLASRTLGEF